MKRKLMIAGILMVAMALLVPNLAMGYSYSIAPGDNDSQTIFGESGDDISIEIKAADKPLNLYIMTFANYLEYSSPAEDTTTYTVDAEEPEYEIIMGDSGDVWEIELISSSEPVNLKIADDFLNLTSANIGWEKTNVTSGEWTWAKQDDGTWYLIIQHSNPVDVICKLRLSNPDAYDTSWEQLGVTTGKWDWTMPTDDTWELVIENPNEEAANTEIVIGGGSFLNEGSEGCGSILVAAVFIPLVLVVGLSYYVRYR